MSNLGKIKKNIGERTKLSKFRKQDQNFRKRASTYKEVNSISIEKEKD